MRNATAYAYYIRNEETKAKHESQKWRNKFSIYSNIDLFLSQLRKICLTKILFVLFSRNGLMSGDRQLPNNRISAERALS